MRVRGRISSHTNRKAVCYRLPQGTRQPNVITSLWKSSSHNSDGFWWNFRSVEVSSTCLVSCKARGTINVPLFYQIWLTDFAANTNSPESLSYHRSTASKRRMTHRLENLSMRAPSTITLPSLRSLVERFQNKLLSWFE
jgi:hypothetical protein